MSGVAGIWQRDGRPVQPALLAAIGARQAHRGPDGDGHWVQGAVGLTCQILRATPQSLAEVQPLVHASGAVAVFDGRLDTRDELLAVLHAPGLSPESSDAAFVLAAYDAYGEAFVDHLNGDFALALFDPRRERLLLARDAIGIKPLHYCFAGNTFLFASEIKCLLAHPDVSTTPSNETLADFLIRGGACGTGGRTFFEGIFTVPPSHLAVVTARGFVTRRYWEFDMDRQVRLGSFGEYAEAFAHHFTVAVRRRLRTARPAVVSVSGGLDSSSIFCVAQRESLHAAGVHRPVGLSHLSPEGSPADERRFLLEIERAYGVAIDRIPGGLPGVMGQSRNELWHVEAPFLDALGNRLHGLLRATRERGTRVLLGGQWGDQVLCERSYLVDLARRFRWLTVRRHLKEYRHWHEDVESPGFTREFHRELIRFHAPGALVVAAKRLRSIMRPSGVTVRWYTNAFSQRAAEPVWRRSVPRQSRGSAHAQSLYREVRNSYHVLCMESNDKAAAMYGLEMAFPFLDRDLLSFLMAIPGDMQTWRGIPKVLLREGLRDIVPEPILARRGKADFTDLLNEGMERDLSEMSACLRSPGLAIQWGYVKHDAIISELNRLRGHIGGPDGTVAWALQELLSLELWLQVFFGAVTETRSTLNHAGSH
jgi:asparagine synthase (glutamine-hydrolysing)